MSLVQSTGTPSAVDARIFAAQQAARDGTAAIDAQQMLASVEELTALAALFGRRAGEARERANERLHALDLAHILDEDVQAKIEQLRAAASEDGATAHRLVTAARAAFPDASDLALAMRWLSQRAELDAHARELAREADAQLAAGQGIDARAGVHAARTARGLPLFAALDPKALRRVYRRLLTQPMSEDELYAMLLEEAGFEHRHRVLVFLITTLVHDLTSHDPSCTRAEFGPLLDKAVGLRQLQSSDRQFCAQLGAPAPNPRASELARAAVDLLLAGLRGDKTLDLLQAAVERKLCLAQRDQLAVFIRALYASFATVPGALFRDPVRRDELLEELSLASQQALGPHELWRMSHAGY